MAALHLDSGYLRLNPGAGSGWGTSLVVLPSYWCGGTYHQGARIAATWRVEDTVLVLTTSGVLGSGSCHLSASSEIRLSPPGTGRIVARIAVRVEGRVPLDDRPGEAFKPLLLSSMHISRTRWDARAACAAGSTITIPQQGWVFLPPVTTRDFALLGGSSAWKANAPTLAVRLAQKPLAITGWVTPSRNPNDDNLALWAAAPRIRSSYAYEVAATRP